MSHCLIFGRTVCCCHALVLCLKAKVVGCALRLPLCFHQSSLSSQMRASLGDVVRVWVVEKTARMHDDYKTVKRYLHRWSYLYRVLPIRHPCSCCSSELNQEQKFGALLGRARGLAGRGRHVKDQVLSSFVGRKLSSVDRTSFSAPKLTLDSVGGGYWSPDARALAALRTTIDENPQRLKDVLMNDKMRAEFLSGCSKKAAVQSFVKTNAETALKTKPKVSSQPLLEPLHT